MQHFIRKKGGCFKKTNDFKTLKAQISSLAHWLFAAEVWY